MNKKEKAMPTLTPIYTPRERDNPMNERITNQKLKPKCLARIHSTSPLFVVYQEIAERIPVVGVGVAARVSI